MQLKLKLTYIAKSLGKVSMCDIKMSSAWSFKLFRINVKI